MKTNKRALTKHFSAILRKRALATTEVNENINPAILKSLTRKELIQIIKEKYNGSIPKEYSLAEMENEELLNIIGDDMYIIAYVTQKWSREPKQENIEPAKSNEPKLESKKDILKNPKPLKKK